MRRQIVFYRCSAVKVRVYLFIALRSPDICFDAHNPHMTKSARLTKQKQRQHIHVEK
jgi:hypothetical protein